MSDQGTFGKFGQLLIHTTINLFKPDISKLVIFAILSSLFLIIKYQIFEFPAGQACPLSTLKTTYTGLPFSFYHYDRLQNTQFHLVNLLLNLLLFYGIACLLATFAHFGINSIRHKHNVSRIIFFAIGINIVVVIFVSIKVMGPDWLVKSIRSQQSVVTNTLLILGTSSNSISFRNGRYALQEAVRHNNAALTNLLIKYGASVNAHDTKGQTALHVAVSRNALSAASILLRSGANPNALDQSGRSPAHSSCSVAMAKLLYSYKANPNIADKNHQRVEDTAINVTTKKYWASKSAALSKALAQNVNTAKITHPKKLEQSNSLNQKSNFTIKSITALKSLAGCTHTIGGSLFANGQEYTIKVSRSGYIVAYSGMHGFAYAKCNKKGFYHILIQIAGEKPTLYKNLFHESSDSEPLSIIDKQTVLIHLSVASSQAKIYWYFSEKKIKNLLTAIKKGQVAEIGTNPLKVIAIRKKESTKSSR